MNTFQVTLSTAMWLRRKSSSSFLTPHAFGAFGISVDPVTVSPAWPISCSRHIEPAPGLTLHGLWAWTLFASWRAR